MLKINDLINAAEGSIKRSQEAVDAILASAKQEGRASLTEIESRQVDRHFGDIDIQKGKLAEYRQIQAEDASYEARSRETVPANLPQRNGRTATFSVTQNERTYRPDNSGPNGVGFVQDVLRAQVFQDPAAHARLSRHMDEERVERGAYVERAGDINTSGMGGLVVPQFLVDMTAPKAAAKRPFADACTRHQIPPEGMSFTIPLVTTATGVGLQSAENAAVTDTAMAETDLNIVVKTSAGAQSLSRQAVERGRVDEFVIQDLFNRHATVLDNELINGSTTGLDAVANSAATAGVTASQVYSAILGRQNQVETTLLNGKADLCVMHGRRWAWLSAQMSSTWPLINNGVAGIPAQSMGTANNQGYNKGFRGALPNGLAVVTDNNIATNKGAGTNEDPLYVVSSAECHLWEDANAPYLIRAEQPLANQLSVLLVVYSYFAYTFNRYSGGAGKVSGLTAPTF
jgi:HK97 family phage major capsid protein